jgi:hypothetical protein
MRTSPSIVPHDDDQDTYLLMMISIGSGWPGAFPKIS